MNEKLLKIKELLSSLIPEEVIEMEAITSDKAVLYVESIEEGKEVKVGDENGENRTPAEDGEYLLEDGRTLVVTDGKISEIKEKEEEENPEPETEDEKKDEDFSTIKAKFEESYGEKEQKIAEAIRATGVEDFWIVEAGDEYAVINVWDNETGESKYVKYLVTWTDDVPSVEESGEVIDAFIPKEDKKEIEDNPAPEAEPETKEDENMEDEPAPEPEEEKEPEVEERDLAKELDDLKAIVDELQKKLEKVENEDTKTPQEEFEAMRDADKNLPKAVKYLNALHR